jgi:hypothetical protein
LQGFVRLSAGLKIKSDHITSTDVTPALLL